MRNRISVTHLDSYQYYLDTDMSEQELYERLYGAYQPNLAMQAGTALHKLLEDCSDTLDSKCGDFEFVFDSGIDGEIITGEPCEREVKHVWQGVQGVDLVGIIDVDAPFMVIDHKLTSRYDPERYFNSWQWRAYLTMLGKDKFRYQVFECSDIKPGEPITIKDYHTLDMHSYEGMQNEVVGLVGELSELINKWLVQGLPCKKGIDFKKLANDWDKDLKGFFNLSEDEFNWRNK